MDQMTIMFAAALLLAAEQGFATPEGVTPTFAVADDGSVTVTAGEQSFTAAIDALAETAAAIGETYADPGEDAEMPAEEMPA